MVPRPGRYLAWGWGIILGGLLLVFYRDRLEALVLIWVSDGIYSLCPFVPLISLGLIYLQRNRYRALPVKPSGWGLLGPGLAVTLTIWFDYRAVGLIAYTPALLALTLAGGVVALRGWQTLRQMAFPLLFLLFLMPAPPTLMTAIDYPLQAVCARTTAGISSLVGLPVQCAGAQLLFPNPDISLLVAPACNGLRSTVALLAIASVYAYLLKGALYKRCALVLAAVPLAYVGNFARLLGLVLIIPVTAPASPRFIGMLDAGLGLMTFALPLALLYLLARVLRCTEFQPID